MHFLWFACQIVFAKFIANIFLLSAILSTIKTVNYQKRMHCLLFYSHEYAIGTASANSAKNSVESDHGCTSRIYFENAAEYVTLTLYNVTLTLTQV